MRTPATVPAALASEPGPDLIPEPTDGLQDCLERELRASSWAAVDAAVAAIRSRHGESVAAILFYGSCLRDRCDVDRLLDFYVLTDRYRDFHGTSLLAVLNRVLPPNVYYLELPFEGRTVRAKYAVLSLPALRRQTARKAFLPTLWARFAQPCALPFARDAAAFARVRDALASSVVTMLAETAPLLTGPATLRQLWVGAFAATYRTELRPERSNRPEQLYAAAPDRYDALARTVLGNGLIPDCALAPDGTVRTMVPAARRRWFAVRWALRRMAGRTVHVARLIKATLTFTDGLDYALWKIGTHSGVTLKPTPWQRRHPLLAAPSLLVRLYRRGALG